jgi:hypothetical protein
MTKIDPTFGNWVGGIKFTITVRCASGHTQVVTRRWPRAECAEAYAQVVRTGKCGICETKLEAHIATGKPIIQEIDRMEFN